MLIRNILKKAAAMLGEDIDFDTVTDGAADFLQCADTVYNEITSEYFPLLFEEDIYFDYDGRAAMSGFSKKMLYAVSVKFSGANVKYAVFPSDIYAESMRSVYLTVRYAYVPAPIESADYITESDFGITERTFALGVACEYCLMKGMFNESLVYDKRYKDSLKSAARKHGEIKVKGRNWLR
ncbi:MAG: hypothetical protein LBT30_04140 [Clostridiales bacterium]|jgi:hypothetical protein|nr:hypothetical protein [Clostridiales bacterium]